MIPYKDDNPRVLVPYVTYALVGMNVVIFLFQNISAPAFTNSFAIIPQTVSENFTYYVMTLFTSMFLHGGLMHLGGNMLYLWIFADNIESVLGHVKFIIFYLASGLAAGILQTVIDPGSTIPVIGASGAIAGVLGAYMITFPRARVHTLVFLFVFITTIRIPAIYVLGFWFLFQLTNGLITMGIDTTGGIAWFAHIGGFVAGIGFIKAIKMIRIDRV
ncbi:MAG: rhomboid family intramembrane serine protease [Candidatus Marinimicrobia bacterium]|nr:rhomboid family intramembrane serine protease [Candidatus Neomarinimicrobiota bacterium]